MKFKETSLLTPVCNRRFQVVASRKNLVFQPKTGVGFEENVCKRRLQTGVSKGLPLIFGRTSPISQTMSMKYSVGYQQGFKTPPLESGTSKTKIPVTVINPYQLNLQANARRLV